jgi:nitrous oxidase accessory protein
MNIKLFLIILFLSQVIHARDITVSANNSISSVKQAINSSNPGDRIVIKKGFYYESGIVINKPVAIIGEEFPEIDGQNQEEIFTVLSDGVRIEGVVVKNSGFSNLRDFSGIRIEDSKNCKLTNNRIINCFFGIYLANSSSCFISGNTIISNAVSESSSGNGIHLWKCSNITIENNYVSRHRDGIYFEFATESSVTGNTSEHNIRYGLHFMFSNSDTYENNLFRSNGAGVAVMYTRFVKMINNRFEENWGPNAYGLLLKEISDSYISGCNFVKNTVGVYNEGGTRIRLEHSSFTENGWAMKILGNSTDDTIINNNFIGNTFDISTNASRSENLFSGNYWDKYRGYDINNDGFGDVYYRPVSLFSMMVERTPETIVLLRSFLVDILDIAEKVVPVFIPEMLIDERPKMEPYNKIP